MKLHLNIGLAMAAITLVMAFNESTALARIPSYCRATLPPPSPQCTGRNAAGYLAGVGQGVSTVDQIWEADAVGQNPDNWEILVARVTTTIPTTVATIKESTWSDYLMCRTQGLLDGSVCRMNELDPIPGCQLDGADWGHMSAAIYCQLSIDLLGLADVAPWFIRPPAGMCGGGFQTYCEDVYRYGATNGGDPLDSGVLDLLTSRGVDPATLIQAPECVTYTVTPWTTTFDDAVAVDCSYTIP